MDSILNYSENDFPSLGCSAKGRSRKRNKFLSSVVNQNAGGNENANQPQQSNCNKEIIEIPSLVDDSSRNQHQEICQKSNVSRKPRPTSSVNIHDFLMVVFYSDSLFFSI